ncbi:MAG: DNA-binding transcriptional MerR regulator [Candidatus Binatia bacterium]|jgi:DNA-binding transcriptional MerR regulator
MNDNSTSPDRPHEELEPFQPGPGAVYSLETTARHGGVTRRTLLIYWKHGMVRPRDPSPDEAPFFTDEAIQRIRHIEFLRTAHGANLASVKIILSLSQELERLQEELNFLRKI